MVSAWNGAALCGKIRDKSRNGKHRKFNDDLIDVELDAPSSLRTGEKRARAQVCGAARDAACACLVSVARACGRFRLFRLSQALAGSSHVVVIEMALAGERSIRRGDSGFWQRKGASTENRFV